jgi:hypothetical protein
MVYLLAKIERVRVYQQEKEAKGKLVEEDKIARKD